MSCPFCLSLSGGDQVTLTSVDESGKVLIFSGSPVGTAVNNKILDQLKAEKIQ